MSHVQQQMPPRPPVPPSAPSASPRTPDFMKYPYPEIERILGHLETLSGVKEESKRCIANLLSYRAVRTRARLPRGSSAAVLVPLFVGRSGDLYVLLSRRSDALKAFSGDTALPGGKVDAQDVTVEDTARREAFEEIGLPQDKERVPLLCVMEPRLAKGEILVTPVVVLILDNDLQPNLNSYEVTSIFAQPLVSFLSSTPHFSSGRTADPNNTYHTFTDLPWGDEGAVRLHRFLTGREAEGIKPVFGLTAAILIKTATVGYGRPPEFEVQPANAPSPERQIARALLTPANPLRLACEREGIDANKAAGRLLCPPVVADSSRTLEIGTERKRLMDGDNADRVDATLGKGTGSGSGTRSAPRDGSPGGEGLHKRVKEMRVLDQANDEDGRDMEELGPRIDAHKKRAVERKDADMAKLGEFLDKTRDMVNERMEEVKGDEKKLAKARKTYPESEAAHNEDGELDSKASFAMILEEGLREGKKGTRSGLEEMRKHIGKDEQTLRKKRNVKL